MNTEQSSLIAYPTIDVNPGGLGGSRPPDFEHGKSWGLQGGSREWGRGGSTDRGRVIKYYYILSCTCRKYVWKWWLSRRNRIIYPEIAVDSQYLPGKSKFFLKLPKNQNLSEICLEKSNFLVKLPEKKSIVRKSKFLVKLPKKWKFL